MTGYVLIAVACFSILAPGFVPQERAGVFHRGHCGSHFGARGGSSAGGAGRRERGGGIHPGPGRRRSKINGMGNGKSGSAGRRGGGYADGLCHLGGATTHWQNLGGARVDGGDGVQLVYERSGPIQGRPVLLQHKRQRNYPKILRNRKQRIQRPLAPKNWADQPCPLLKASNIHYEMLQS